MWRSCFSDMYHRCSRTSWTTSACSSLPDRSRGMERTIGSKIWLTQRCALYSSSISGLLSARNESMSLSSRRAWFSWASSPVRRSRRRMWWPASTTFGWSWMVEPFWVVRSERVHVIEQPAGLVFLGIQPGEAQQAPHVVACVHDLRLELDGGAVLGGQIGTSPCH